MKNKRELIKIKITRSGEDISRLDSQRKNANIGCDKCPSCGETKRCTEYFCEDVMFKGLSSGKCRIWREGLFKTKNYRVDCYLCNTCGARWESDKYECS